MFNTMLLSKIFKKMSSKSLTSVKAGGGAPASTYQSWTGYPDVPVLLSAYPFQNIGYNWSIDKWFFYASITAFYVNSNNGTDYTLKNATPVVVYRYNTATLVWDLVSETTDLSSSATGAMRVNDCQTNNDIYTDATLTVVSIAQNA